MRSCLVHFEEELAQASYVDRLRSHRSAFGY